MGTLGTMWRHLNAPKPFATGPLLIMEKMTEEHTRVPPGEVTLEPRDVC